MPLAEWQDGLLDALQGIEPTGLSPEEAASIERLRGESGFRLLQDIRDGWRRLRLRRGAPLLFAALTGASGEALEREWLRQFPCPSFFDGDEVVQFVRFLLSLSDLPPHVRSLARLAEAWIVASGAAPSLRRGAPPKLAEGVSVVTFQGPWPNVVLAATRGGPMPALGRRSWVLIAPGDPPGLLDLGPDERWAVIRLRRGHALQGSDVVPVERLALVGALR